MPTVGKIHDILNKIQNAGAPETFNVDFLADLGFTSSNDRPVVKVLKYLGFLDSAGRPQTTYREFLDHNKSKAILAARLRAAYDDLFLADREAHKRTAAQLKGWFKTKTGVGDAVADKIAATFKTLADYADFDAAPTPSTQTTTPEPLVLTPPPVEPPQSGSGEQRKPLHFEGTGALGLVYRLEIHLPDSQNIDTFRAIFKALREELM
jgi:hypothetical protein